MITAKQMQSILGISAKLANLWQPYIAKGLLACACTTTARKAAWLAQVGHESGCLRYTREVWGPTKQQLRYERPTTLAKTLGNTEAGDGKRYMGRGLLQITGRSNYRNISKKLSAMFPDLDIPDFEINPEKLELPQWAVMSAVVYWNSRNLNRFCDSGDFTELTRRINGGYNGLAHRQHLQLIAALILEKSDV